MKQTSFSRELDCLDRHIRSFCVFDLFRVKKTQRKRKNLTLIFFKILLFKNSKNLECDALLLVFVNEIKSAILFYL